METLFYLVRRLVRLRLHCWGILFRGEDPNAKFLALVAQREADSTGGKLRRWFKKRGKGARGGEEGSGE